MEIGRRYTLLRELAFHIENRGYLSKYRHYTIEEEVERDYPELVLVVTKKCEEHYFEVDPYQTSDPVRAQEITAKLDE